MKKLILLLILCIITLNIRAQWLEQATGFTTASRGVNQIIIVDQNTVWASAYDGTNPTAAVRDFTRTTDGGTTWTPGIVTGPPASNNWSCLTAVDDQNAWGLFYKTTGTQLGGGLWHTSNGGASWSQQTVFGSSSFPDIVYFWNASTGLALGDPVAGEFEIYTTTDGGTTWNAVPAANIPNPNTGEYGLVQSVTERNGIVWCGTTDGRLLKTSDYGNNWSALETGYSANYIMSPTFANESMGWVLAQDASAATYKLLRTTDGGASWSNLTLSNSDTAIQISYVPYTVATIVASWVNAGNYGTSYSTDGGDTWTEIDNGVQHTIVNFLNNTTGWSGSFNVDATTGGIFKYTGAFVADGFVNIDPSIKFNLYPNPSNGLFYFSFDVENNQPVHITVTDAMGKLIFDKVYKDKSQTWLRSIDLRSFSKGIYFLNLENNGNHTTQKLVIN